MIDLTQEIAAAARKRKREKLLADRARLMQTVAKLDAEIARLA